MTHDHIRRRQFLTEGGAAAAAGFVLLHGSQIAQAFPQRDGAEVIPWLDQRPPFPAPEIVPQQLDWEKLDSWITPDDQFFQVGHYGFPAVDASTWELPITGMVEKPMTFTLDDLKARPKQEVIFTIECAGNHGFPSFTGGIGNARWAGTPLAPILEEVGLADGAVDVVFFGADNGEETIRDVTVQSPFARSLSVADARNPNLLLCYEMNGQPLPQNHGYPLRLIAPGWYGVANVKWLSLIQVIPKRFEGRFMGRDYVTIREEPLEGQILAVETSVGRARLKSAPGRVTKLGNEYRIIGAAWGGEIAAVEVQIDEGAWQTATIDEVEQGEYAWKIWWLDWPNPGSGEHRITSRAITPDGQVQPTPDEPPISNKLTYWESNGQVTRTIKI